MNACTVLFSQTEGKTGRKSLEAVIGSQSNKSKSQAGKLATPTGKQRLQLRQGKGNASQISYFHMLLAFVFTFSVHSRIHKNSLSIPYLVSKRKWKRDRMEMRVWFEWGLLLIWVQSRAIIITTTDCHIITHERERERERERKKERKHIILYTWTLECIEPVLSAADFSSLVLCYCVLESYSCLFLFLSFILLLRLLSLSIQEFNTDLDMKVPGITNDKEAREWLSVWIYTSMRERGKEREKEKRIFVDRKSCSLTVSIQLVLLPMQLNIGNQ